MDSQRYLTSLRVTPPSAHSASISLARSAVNSGLVVDCTGVGMQSAGVQKSVSSTGDTHASIRRRTLNR